LNKNIKYINKVIQGDCLEVMKDFPDNCIDTIITDPPYGLKFMGKEWDNFRNSKVTKSQVIKNLGTGMRQTTLQENINFMEWTTEWATEALRVLKPGGTALIFAGSRTQHLIAFGVELAGFILKDCIMWLYGSGFPKATDISKILDKDECRKQLIKKLGRKPTKEEFEKEWKEFRIVIEEKYRGKNAGKQSGIMGKTVERTDIKTAPATPEAILWNGWKSHGLKPAYEPILVAMKPNEGSYANNALKWGVAGLNIDGGRLPTQGRKTGTKNPNAQKGSGNCYQGSDGKKQMEYDLQSKGRFPANIILDEEAGRLLDEQTQNVGNTKPHKIKSNIEKYEGYGSITKKTGEIVNYNEPNSKGASRFFYCAKASKSERNRGCEGLDIPEYRWNNGGICQQIKGQKGNCHPTVKPLSLMKYLCTITKNPTSGIVLDPFCGSGTTLMACKETGRKYIGIEKEKKYCDIAIKRINETPARLFY